MNSGSDSYYDMNRRSEQLHSFRKLDTSMSYSPSSPESPASVAEDSPETQYYFEIPSASHLEDGPLYPIIQGSSSSGLAHPTPSSLGWGPDTQPWRAYSFVVTKVKEPYLELLPGFHMTRETPQRVYLDVPATETKGFYPCQFPGGCSGKMTSWKRAADLERHYINVHASSNDRPSFRCDYGPCHRSKKSFSRKDHYRDHLRDYHKEDIGSAKGERSYNDKKKWMELQNRWLAERFICPQWWRCVRCLNRVQIANDGWECGNCKQACESERRESREKMLKKAEVAEQSTSSYTSNCSTCNGTVSIESRHVSGGWEACPNCQKQAPSTMASTYEISSWDNSQHSSYHS